MVSWHPSLGAIGQYYTKEFGMGIPLKLNHLTFGRSRRESIGISVGSLQQQRG